MNYKVKYPSGVTFTASGRFFVGKLDGLQVVGIDLDSAALVKGNYCPAGSVLAIDPRAVVYDEEGKLVYRGPKTFPAAPK